MLDDFHDSACQLSIQLIIAGEHGYLLVGNRWSSERNVILVWTLPSRVRGRAKAKLLGKLKIWGSGFDAHLLGFVAAGYDTAIIVAQHNNGLAVQVRAKDSFARDIAVITVNDAVHTPILLHMV